MNRRKGPRGAAFYITVLVVAFFLAYMVQNLSGTLSSQIVNLSFSEFVEKLDDGDVTTVKISEGSRSYEGTLKDGTQFIAYAPSDYDMAVVSEQYIVPLSSAGRLNVPSVRPSSWLSILSWIPSIIMLVMIFFLYRNMMGGAGGGVMSFGKNRARMEKDSKVTFNDVAGLEEEKQELSEIVDFLKNPGKYTEIGARIPKGVLLVGPPGTGKTYISKAVAGEANVPFFSISGSDFVEMFVGVGASRVRDLFDDAKKSRRLARGHDVHTGERNRRGTRQKLGILGENSCSAVCCLCVPGFIRYRCSYSG